MKLSEIIRLINTDIGHGLYRLWPKAGKRRCLDADAGEFIADDSYLGCRERDNTMKYCD
jgi:hypothetical protein